MKIKLPSLFGTNIQLQPVNKEHSPLERFKEAADYMKIPESKLKLTHKYLWCPHLIYHNEKLKIDLEKVHCGAEMSHDTWARIPYEIYHMTVCPQHMYQTSLSHEEYSEPYDGKLKPIIY